MNRQLWSNVARQVSEGLGVSRTNRNNFAKKTFTDDGQKIVAIEQNPNTGSRWARLAARGYKVVQFKDVETNKYIGVSVNGEVKEY